MPRSTKKTSAASDSPPSTKSKRATEGSAATVDTQKPATTPIPMVTDAELYGYPAYEYPGYNTDPDFDFPEESELLDWGDLEHVPAPPPGWKPPDFDETDEEEASVDAASIPVTAPVTDNTIHSLLDYFAAHALNGLLSAKAAVPETTFDASHTALLAYDYAEAMLRERQERLANQTEAPGVALE